MRETITRERERERERVRGRKNEIGGRDHQASGTDHRKVTGRSRTAMRGEAALTVTHGCVGWGVEERGAKIRREGERDIRRDTERSHGRPFLEFLWLALAPQ